MFILPLKQFLTCQSLFQTKPPKFSNYIFYEGGGLLARGRRVGGGIEPRNPKTGLPHRAAECLELELDALQTVTQQCPPRGRALGAAPGWMADLYRRFFCVAFPPLFSGGDKASRPRLDLRW